MSYRLLAIDLDGISVVTSVRPLPFGATATSPLAGNRSEPATRPGLAQSILMLVALMSFESSTVSARIMVVNCSGVE